MPPHNHARARWGARADSSSDLDGSRRPPLFGLPTVYCQDTGQFMCAWCNKLALREKDRKKLTRYSIPLVESPPLRFAHGIQAQMLPNCRS